MAKRFGAVITFKPGVTKEQAAAALAQIGNVVEFPAEHLDFPRKGPLVKRPFRTIDAVQEYDDAYGGPVWYIP